jgi:hypothetical protein
LHGGRGRLAAHPDPKEPVVRAASLPDTFADAVPDAAREQAAAILEDARRRADAVLGEAAVRGGAAWDALRGERVGPPVAVARWPWALAAAAAGAAAGVAVAIAVRRFSQPEAPDAQDPEDVRAVIDRPS